MVMEWDRIRYTAWAPGYDRLVRSFPAIERARRRSIDLLGLRASERVLIVGAGTGLDLPHLPAVAHVAAIDVTPAMLDRLRERARVGQQSVDARVGDARRLPWADGEFDAVVLHLVLAVMPEPERALAEVDRVLRAGGRAAVFDKFLAPHQTPSLVRRLMNTVARVLFSDLNRRLEPLVAGTTLVIERDEPAAFRGAYRVVGLRKRA
jgi:ubiquinone/menaquinone biosynthesis C-methylase UbiE